MSIVSSEESNMKTFWRLLEESIIVQGIVTCGMVGALIYLWVTGQSVPSELYSFAGLLLGFWFGTKTQFAINKASKV